MKQQSGFTLIELIIVIVILGILAVTAAPKFIDIQGDAQASTLQGVKAALQGGAQLVYAKSAIAGRQNNASASDSTSQVDIGSNTVETDFGYPDAETITTMAILGYWVDISSDDFDLTAGSGSAATGSPADGEFGITLDGTTPDFSVTTTTGDSCHVVYTEAVDADTPAEVTVVTGGC